MTDYRNLRSLVQSYLPPDDLELVDKAYRVAFEAHQGQYRHSGEPYVCHPVAVAYILAQYSLDSEIICACLLHDVLEDTDWTFEDLSSRFGHTIATLVDGVSKLRQIEFPTRAHEQAENLWKMMLAIAKDLRVIIIKLADRLHNMRTLGSLRKEKQHRKALETLEIYAPMAARIGMYEFKKEFENLGFAALYPWRSQVLYAAIDRALAGQRPAIERAIGSILERSPSLSAILLKKSAHDLYGLMKKERIRFRDLKDFCMLEILCESTEACYATLGQIHQAYRPLMYRFRDYIALPKGNGYQAIHTTILLSPQLRLEIHIRSKQMNAIALRGVAANSQEQYQRAQRWIAAMIGARHEHSTSIEFAAHFKEDLHREDLYIFDDKGEIWTLPQGSTPIDFAYLYHPMEAPYCSKAFVNNKAIALGTPLKNGQTLSLVYGDQILLEPSWLLWAGSAKARAHIHQQLRSHKQKEAEIFGEKLFVQALQQHGLHSPALSSDYWQSLGYATPSALFLAIGLGKIDLLQILGTKNAQKCSSVEVVLSDSVCSLMVPSACCYPEPGDRVRVFPSGNEGWEVHREDCPQCAARSVTTSFLMEWTLDSPVLVADLEIYVMHQPGALAQISQVIAQLASNIQSIYTDPNMNRMEQKIRLRLTVRDREHLQELLNRLREIPFVRRIARIG